VERAKETLLRSDRPQVIPLITFCNQDQFCCGYEVTPPCRLSAGSGARSPVLALYADLPFMYLFVLGCRWLVWAGHVFKGDGGFSGLASSGVLPGGAGGGDEGVRHAGEQFDGLAAG
jgi:hypothetical protein